MFFHVSNNISFDFFTNNNLVKKQKMDALGHFGVGLLSGVGCGLLTCPTAYALSSHWRLELGLDTRRARVGIGSAYLLASQLAIPSDRRVASKRGFISGIAVSVTAPAFLFFSLNMFSGMSEKNYNIFPLALRHFAYDTTRHVAVLSPLLIYRIYQDKFVDPSQNN